MEEAAAAATTPPAVAMNLRRSEIMLTPSLGLWAAMRWVNSITADQELVRQYDRAVLSRRQPGSVFKPFVFLTAFEQALALERHDVTPASITLDEQETFEFDDQVWTPENYEHTYDGPITYRHALAHSRNLGTIHVAQQAGYDRSLQKPTYNRIAPRIGLAWSPSASNRYVVRAGFGLFFTTISIAPQFSSVSPA